MSKRIFILALASFAMGTEAYVYVGHLEVLAADLGQPVATAGQIATAFALPRASPPGSSGRSPPSRPPNSHHLRSEARRWRSCSRA